MTHRSLALLVVLFGSTIHAADPKPNGLTAEEIAGGMLLLFDGETAFGWKVDGSAQVRDGVIVLGKGKKTTAYPTTRFGNYTAEFEWQGKGELESSATGNLQLTDPKPENGKWHRCEIENTNDRHGFKGEFITKTDGKLTRPELEISPFVLVTDGNAELRVRNVKLKPIGKPIFDGKTLTGWKVFPGDKYKSKFDVTPDGELSLKSGPGDLQTERTYADFVLQIECKTLGKALNSGVFFRCIPGQYQAGYEAQIHNGFFDGDRTKPFDHGTGAIYRRVVARRVVSDDNIWFTMTVAANANHIATWVNGYQTADWVDDRPAADNPRQGLRKAAGHISLQGHDPTTNLLFRKIRIGELETKPSGSDRK